MDEYRQTIAGRALADVLQELERSGNLGARDGDALFELFDAAVQEEIFAATRTKRQSADASVTAPATHLPLFTHDNLALRAHIEAYNSFNEKWSIAATLQDRGSGDGTQHALTLDKVALPLPPPHSARMLLKLHSRRPPLR